MIRRVHGTVYGKTIEIDEDLGLSDGDKVSITIESSQSIQDKWGEGLRRCAGALADDWTEEDAKILKEIYRSRHSDSRPEIL
jgi:hypothetical protein